MKVIGYVFLIIYAVLTIIASYKGRKKIPRRAYYLMMIGSLISVIATVFECLKMDSVALVITIISLVAIQISAILNGYYLYGKINYRHQSIRLLLNITIITFLII